MVKKTSQILIDKEPEAPVRQLDMRGVSAGLFLLNSVLATVLVGFSLLALKVMQHDSIPAGVGFLISAMVLVFLLIPGIVMLLDAVASFFTKVEICEDRIIFTRPFRKRKCFSLDQITCFGCYARARRSSILFFCTEDTAAVEEYLQTHWDQCRKLFGTDRIEKLQSSEQGLFRLAVGTYLRYSPTNVFTLCYGSAKRLSQVVQAMKNDAILTGPVLIDDEAGWEKYSTYLSDEQIGKSGL